MISTAIILAAVGCASVFVGWATYLATIPKGTVPARPVSAIILNLGGATLAVAGIVVGLRGGGSPGAGVIAPASQQHLLGLGRAHYYRAW